MIATLLIISILLITIFNSEFSDFIINSLGKVRKYHLLKEYTVNYKNGIKIFKDYPLFGVGNKNFGMFVSEIPSGKDWNWMHKPPAPNIELLSEHGIIGTAVIF